MSGTEIGLAMAKRFAGRTGRGRIGGVWLMVGVLLAGVPAAGEDSSLSDLDIEFSEAKLTIESVASENAALRGRLKIAAEQVRSLTESLAVAQGEAEVFRRECRELRLRMEALGIESASPDRAKIEQRLLAAVRELQASEETRDKLADHFIALSEAIVRFLQSAESVDAEARQAVEEAMRAGQEALGLPSSRAVEAAPVAATLTDAMVMSVKEEMALAVANVGRHHGVEVGMPFQVWRGDKRIGMVRAVDVRDKIAGVVIQELESGKDGVKVGDRLKIDAQ